MEPFSASGPEFPIKFDVEQQIPSDNFVQFHPLLSGILGTTITRVLSTSPVKSPGNYRRYSQNPVFWMSKSCVVCGDRAVGRHYNATSCEGCKGFFKRSIRRKMDYYCRNSQNCIVTKASRNCCQYCRLQKCLKMGMRCESVQYQRSLLSPNKPESNSSSESKIDVEGKNKSDETVAADSDETVAADSDETVAADSDETVAADSAQPKTIGGDPVMLSKIEKGKLESIIPEECIKFNLVAPNHLLKDNLQYIHEMSARLLFLSIKWMHSLPLFHSLSLEIQLSVVKCAWSDLFCLGLVQCQKLFPLNYLTDGLRVHLQSKTINDVQQLSSHLSKILIIFKEGHSMNIDDHEFAAMKVLAIFSPDHFSDYGVSIVNSIVQLQPRILRALKHHIISYVAKREDKIDASSRVEQLLLLLCQIRGLNGAKIKELFFTNFWASSFDDLVSFTLTNCNEGYFANLDADHDGFKPIKTESN